MTVLWFIVSGSIGATAYVYVGYPLLVWILAALKRNETEAAEPLHLFFSPPVTLIVAAFNEEAWIARKLGNSVDTDYPADRLQIVVAADGSTDRTADIVRTSGLQSVELSYQAERAGKMEAINRAMKTVTGDIIIFSDANNEYEPSTIGKLVAPFDDPQVGCVTGAKTIQAGDGPLGDSEGLYWKYESWIKGNETKLGCCTSVAGEVMAIRRNLFEPAPPKIINDDFYMAMRIVSRGYDLVYVDDARSRERVSCSAEDEVRRRSRIVAGRYQAIFLGRELLPWRRPLVAWQVISHKYLRPLVPLFMLVALAANVLLVAIDGLRPGPAQGLLVLQLLFYTVAKFGSTFDLDGPLGTVLYLPSFLVSSNRGALEGLFGYLAGRQTVMWERAERRQEPKHP